MEREKLTQKQERILEYINKFYLENRYTPTVRDICKEFGLKINIYRCSTPQKT